MVPLLLMCNLFSMDILTYFITRHTYICKKDFFDKNPNSHLGNGQILNAGALAALGGFLIIGTFIWDPVGRSSSYSFWKSMSPSQSWHPIFNLTMNIIALSYSTILWHLRRRVFRIYDIIFFTTYNQHVSLVLVIQCRYSLSLQCQPMIWNW